jgi:histidine triad (HIT) family protein
MVDFWRKRGELRMAKSCIFCSIAAGEAAAQVIGETEHTLTILDVNPVVDGHALVIPKLHCVDVTDCPDGLLGELIVEARKTALRLKDALGASGVNILNANGRSAQQSVFHLHFHVVPRYDGDSLNLWPHGDRSPHTPLEEMRRLLAERP